MIVCADDIGMTEEINQAALDLAAMNRISAVSCMVVGAKPPFAALRLLKTQLDIGLHVTLTDSLPAASPHNIPSLMGPGGKMGSFRSLLGRSLTGLIDSTDVACEIAAQYGRFVEWAGRPPDFLDSHLHVHQLPDVRTGLVNFRENLPQSVMPYVRNAHLPFARMLTQGVSVSKCFLIGFQGGLLLKRLRARGIPTNKGFAGIYDYRRFGEFPRFLKQFTSTVTDPSGIVMTHPGLTEPWRRAEYDGLCQATYLPALLTRFPQN